MRVAVLGAGVAGLTCAVELAARGAQVALFERDPEAAGSAGGAPRACSWFAGGMLAPWCERENSAPLIAQLGEESLPWWRQHCAATRLSGTLVVAHPRDTAELAQFARRTGQFERLDESAVAALEPALAGRFAQGLYFRGEGHLEPRQTLAALRELLRERAVPIYYGSSPEHPQLAGRTRVDCTGLGARTVLPELRGVKGEMLILKPREALLSRPVRVLHPRLPVYVVPRADGTCMVGASMIESEDTAVSARSMLELLSAAYALHPAFGEAQILEMGAAARPAFPDNLPRLHWLDGVLYVNGLYRHGFLLAPALAARAAQAVLQHRHFPEVMDESTRQRRLA